MSVIINLCIKLYICQVKHPTSKSKYMQYMIKFQCILLIVIFIFCIFSKYIQITSIEIRISSWLKHIETNVNFQYFCTYYWCFDTFNIFWYFLFISLVIYIYSFFCIHNRNGKRVTRSIRVLNLIFFFLWLYYNNLYRRRNTVLA